MIEKAKVGAKKEEDTVGHRLLRELIESQLLISIKVLDIEVDLAQVHDQDPGIINQPLINIEMINIEVGQSRSLDHNHSIR